jgi:putative thioredoxin
MTAPGHILEGTRANFPALVVEGSARGPVPVRFPAEWAVPCHRLHPVLAGLARDYGGRFLLVSLNSDDHGAVARDHRVTSPPTVKLFRDGRVVETVHGYPPKAEWRRLIDRYVGRVAEGLRRYRASRDDAPRRGLLALFPLLGPQDPRVEGFRSRLAAALAG